MDEYAWHHWTLYEKMSSGTFKNFIKKIIKHNQNNNKKKTKYKVQHLSYELMGNETWVLDIRNIYYTVILRRRDIGKSEETYTNIEWIIELTKCVKTFEEENFLNLLLINRK